METNEPTLMKYRGENMMIRFIKPAIDVRWLRVRFSKTKKVGDEMIFDEWHEQLMTKEFFEDQFEQIKTIDI